MCTPFTSCCATVKASANSMYPSSDKMFCVAAGTDISSSMTTYEQMDGPYGLVAKKAYTTAACAEESPKSMVLMILI